MSEAIRDIGTGLTLTLSFGRQDVLRLATILTSNIFNIAGFP